MQREHLKTAAIILLIFFALMIGTGCDEMRYIPVDNMNETELLQTEEVAKLLNGNGASLMEASAFPVDLSLCRIYDKTPRAYFSSSTGLYYLFYEFDDYQEADRAKHLVFTNLEEYPDEFGAALFTYTIAGKNICIYLWYPAFSTPAEGVRSIKPEAYHLIEVEVIRFQETLSTKAFQAKTAILTGSGDSWEVVMPVEYIYNVMQAKEEAGKFYLATKGQTYLKYIGEDSEQPEVHEIRWQKAHGLTTMYTDEGTLLGDHDLYGFRKISSNAPGFHPIHDESITVTITWGSGETEEIVCVTKHFVGQYFEDSQKIPK